MTHDETTIESYWNHAERQELEALCEKARVSTLLASVPWRQISAGFREKIEKAITKTNTP